MKTLLLLRHAKSSWDDLTLDDHDRPLNERGRKAALSIGQFLADHSIKPDHVLMSSALRVQETWERVSKSLPDTPTSDTQNALYFTNPDALLMRLRKTKPTIKTLLLINHEPCISALAHLIAKQPVQTLCNRAFTKYPSAGLAEFKSPDNWQDLCANSSHFVRFTTPKDLL